MARKGRIAANFLAQRTAPSPAIRAGIWVGFNQIGLGMAKVLAHKKRRR